MGGVSTPPNMQLHPLAASELQGAILFKTDAAEGRKMLGTEKVRLPCVQE